MDVDPFSPFPPEPETHQQRLVASMGNKRPNDCFFRNDAEFDWLYPEHLQLISKRHWTPLAVAKKAADYLDIAGNILDIGSGTGKFCLTAAHRYPLGNYYGAEQRHELVHYATVAGNYLDLGNARFIHANITQINFNEFDHFYFFNSFFENIDRKNAIDDTIETSRSLYEYYNRYLLAVLKDKPPGTRVVTYQSLGEMIPANYELAAQSFHSLLRLWIRQ
ncbi:class I SAM-dependent methyltransferase [Mucilaginibacter psychrotolerans]|uniref:Class I SAM-dependent methyltransferase n=1 Tax=Mucilaginibacter psychrotolerans TaxID=1524096 RepID=A0A4Y8S844_9SPHI|nr:class I SAM-dependent methyltransferase [Mucilaginibacter psychrotolerans]TFF34594.1 class I SAM-dependent methyltransferase [Mucilaginibacter psychrotolerans]